MTRLEGIKEAICIQYGIKDRKKIEGKLNMVAQDMLRRKEIQRQEFYSCQTYVTNILKKILLR